MSKKLNRIWAQRAEALAILAASSQSLSANHAGVILTATLFNSKPEEVVLEVTALQLKALEKAEKPAETPAPAAETTPAEEPAAEPDIAAQAAALAAAVDAQLSQS